VGRLCGDRGSRSAIRFTGWSAIRVRNSRRYASGSIPLSFAEPSKAKMQYNFTDPESRIMPGAEGFVQAYNTSAPVLMRRKLLAVSSCAEFG
jgi:hypothetical protein